MHANPVRLSEEIMKAANTYAQINSRSVPKQIEYWVKIGKIAVPVVDFLIRAAL